jgi:PEP-CTERM motif
MKLTLSLLTVSCLTIFLTGATAAHADSFAFEASGLGISSSGVLTALPDPHIPNAFDITGLTAGAFNGAHITLLPCSTYDPSNPCLSSGPDSLFYDNLLYSGSPTLDGSGIGFAIGNSGSLGSFASFGIHQYVFSSNLTDHTVNVSFTTEPPVPTTVPEPGTFILFGTGLLVIASLVRRRIRSERGSAERSTTSATDRS